MKLTQRRVVSIQVLPVIILADMVVPQFAGADEHTNAYGVYKRMNDNMCSWHEDHADPISANNQAMKLAATYGVFIEGREIPKQWVDLPAGSPESNVDETKLDPPTRPKPRHQDGFGAKVSSPKESTDSGNF